MAIKKFFSHSLNYIPGFVILVFGMLAIHSSVRMIDEQDELFSYYYTENKDIFLLEERFNAVENTVTAYLFGSPDVEKSDVQKSLKEFTDLYEEKAKWLFGNSFGHLSQEYLTHFSRIKNSLAELSYVIDEIDVLRQKESGILVFGFLEVVHESVEELWAILYSEEQGGHTKKTIEERAVWLYWSVVAIGLSAFVLVLLNADKLRKLYTVNEERRKTLRLLEHRLLAMEATFDGIGIIDQDGILSYMNKALMDIHAIDPDKKTEFIGQSWENLYTEKGQETIRNDVLPHVREHGYWQGTSPILRQDGAQAVVELSLTRVPDGGYVGTARDITKKLEAEKEKEELQGQFYQAQKMEAIGRLAGGVAHDFNNILAAINGYAEFLTEDLDADSKQHQFAQNILLAGKQARSLVDQILAFSRREDKDVAPLDIVQPIEESLAMLKGSLPKTIDVQADIQIPSAVVRGNSTQISQVIMNLCVNAQDAIGKAHGKLKIALKPVDPSQYAGFDSLLDDLPDPGEVPPLRFVDPAPDRTQLYLGALSKNASYVCLSVEDTGSGMSRVIMERIFEPFFTTKPVDKGTGLGLSTVHGVVTAHRAAIIIDSTLEKGTRFEILFPLSEEDAQEGDIAEDEVENVGGGHVLLVEDQEVVLDMMINMLQRMGLRVTCCSSGLEALDIVRENPKKFDLVITDHNMPKMTGLEFVCQVGIDFPDIPFIMVSGYSDQELRPIMEDQESIKAILRKPVSRQVILQEIKSILSAKGAVRAA